MESNKDEALRCIEIARRHHAEGNIPHAIKFTKKSLNLYPTDQARELLTAYENEHNSGANSATSSDQQPHHTNKHSNHSNHNKNNTKQNSNTSDSNSSPSAQRAYTQEQTDAVQRVRKLKDYYEILEVSKEATEVEIKKQYRKLALIMHPDKNSAPGAEEAFKAVSKAFACLSDPVARKQYDLHGHEAPTHHIHNRQHNHPFAYESEMTPEQLFEMMFNLRPGSTGGFRTYTYRSGGSAGPRRQTAEADGPGAFIFVILPLFLLTVIIFFYGARNNEPNFSLTRVNPYYVQRETQRWGIPYFVKVDTEYKIVEKKIDIGTLETDVERSWKIEMEKKCAAEQHQKNRMGRAVYFSSAADLADLKQKVRDYSTPSCDALREVESY